MEALIAIAIFVIIILSLKHTSQNKKISEVREDFSNEKKNIERAKEVFKENEKLKYQLGIQKELVQKLEAYQENNRRQLEFEISIIDDEKLKLFPWLSTAIADYKYLAQERIAEGLINKERPALKAAEQIKITSQQLRESVNENRALKYHLSFYEKFFPFITEIRETNLEELLEELEERRASEKSVELGDSDDQDEWPILSNYLSRQEYDSLPTENKFQKALDRWTAKKKSNWEIGRDYERYIGYCYESEGFDVKYQGALLGFDDLGRDIIARKGGKTEIIQCKYWAQHKVIHEKHIFQLYGTSIEYQISQNSSGASGNLFSPLESLTDITPVFITSTKLSDKARKFSEILNITVEEDRALDKNYPMIKCNLSNNGEKIFHLPFDQQYDKIKIEPEKKEQYVTTVYEAFELGYRRAKRWRGEQE